MSNLQGWNYMEEQLHRYYLEEYMKNKCQNGNCTNEADYRVFIKEKGRIASEIAQKLCAKHMEEMHMLARKRSSRNIVNASLI